MSKKKVIESTNNSTSSIDPKHCVIEQYRDINDFQMRPVTPAILEKIASALVTWSKDPESIRLEGFCLSFGIKPQVLYRWAETHEIIKDALETTILRLAQNRANGMVFQKYGMRENALKHVHHLYDTQWAEANKYHAELKAQQDKEDASSLGYQMFLDYQAKAKEMKKKD
jgi:hypothetical protein